MRTFLLSLSVLCFLLTAFATDSLQAKSEPSPWSIHSGWFASGSGENFHASHSRTMAVTLTANNGWAATLRNSRVSHDDPWTLSVYDMGLLIGKRFDPAKSVLVVAALGPEYSRYDANVHAVGAGAQVEVVFPLILRYGGLGLTFIGNANSRHSYAAWALTLHLGYVR